MKIIEGYDGRLEGDNVYVSDLKMKFVQTNDSNSSQDDVQELTVEKLNAGGGDYWNISTERWCFNNLDEFIKTLEYFRDISKTLK